jgi:hypothetical protein
VWLTYYAPGGFSTIPEHKPKSHRKHLDWTPTRLTAHSALAQEHAAMVWQAQGNATSLGVRNRDIAES